ncbi:MULTISPECIES: RNA polymerase sigma factor [Chryseobacterium]|jgi:DNA-directed RNA polymerase specialized sigma24 family protein|uniref:RNA polymerase sigma factor n=1 Tax=Chryseobacterium TaxID=59732 RepID=UPI00049304D6|nr:MULTISPECIES: sigma-70 family RNA polymerase sigma factor [Chryseobacterium]MDR6159821.1 DNA-directed RNA polymerase specialized sigma24 family protein [Chryseobacterium sp. SLBN-27]
MDKRTTNTLAIEDFRKDSNMAFAILYQKYFVYTKKFVLNNSGNLEDAEDIFQDALIILYEKLYADNFKAYTCLANYLSGISKNLWLKKLRNKEFLTEIPENYYITHQEEINLAIENERDYWDKLNDYMNAVSSHCKNLIQDIFMNNKNIEEIQSKYKYSSKHNAQNQKHKCVEQIRKIKNNDNF